MANPNQVTGRAKVKINGQLQPTSGDTTLMLGGPMREAVDGDYEAGGYKEMVKGSKVEFSVLSKANFDPVAFGGYTDETVSIEFDTGQSYVIRHAWAEGRPDMAAADGKSKCVLMGPPAEKVL